MVNIECNSQQLDVFPITGENPGFACGQQVKRTIFCIMHL